MPESKEPEGGYPPFTPDAAAMLTHQVGEIQAALSLKSRERAIVRKASFVSMEDVLLALEDVQQSREDFERALSYVVLGVYISIGGVLLTIGVWFRLTPPRIVTLIAALAFLVGAVYLYIARSRLLAAHPGPLGADAHPSAGATAAFISAVLDLEQSLRKRAGAAGTSEDIPVSRMAQTLVERKLIDQTQAAQLSEISRTRNAVVHSGRILSGFEAQLALDTVQALRRSIASP